MRASIVLITVFISTISVEAKLSCFQLLKTKKSSHQSKTENNAQKKKTLVKTPRLLISRDENAILAIKHFYGQGFKTKSGTSAFRSKLTSIRKEILTSFDFLDSERLRLASSKIDAEFDAYIENHIQEPQAFRSDNDALIAWEKIKNRAEQNIERSLSDEELLVHN